METFRKDTIMVLTQSDMDAKDCARMLRYAADCIDYYLRVKSYPDCNTCGIRKECQYCPDLGEQTRINCPLYKGKLIKYVTGNDRGET